MTTLWKTFRGEVEEKLHFSNLSHGFQLLFNVWWKTIGFHRTTAGLCCLNAYSSRLFWVFISNTPWIFQNLSPWWSIVRWLMVQAHSQFILQRQPEILKQFILTKTYEFFPEVIILHLLSNSVAIKLVMIPLTPGNLLILINLFCDGLIQKHFESSFNINFIQLLRVDKMKLHRVEYT